MKLQMLDEYATDSFEKISDILLLERRVYCRDYQGELYTIYERVKKCPNSLILAYDDNVLAGYLCLYPIGKDLYNRVLNKDINGEEDFLDIVNVDVYKEDKANNIYIVSLVTDPDYKSIEIIKSLANGFKQYLQRLEEKQFKVNDILALTVSKQGEHASKLLGLKPLYKLNENETVQKANFDTVYKNLCHITKSGGKL